MCVAFYMLLWFLPFWSVWKGAWLRQNCYASVARLIVKFLVNGLHSLSTIEEADFIALVTGSLSVL